MSPFRCGYRAVQASSRSQTANHSKIYVSATLIKHWWFSGKIGRCQSKSPRLHLIRPAPGSIPGRCMRATIKRWVIIPFAISLGSETPAKTSEPVSELRTSREVSGKGIPRCLFVRCFCRCRLVHQVSEVERPYHKPSSQW